MPEPLYLETDLKWLDRPFFIMEQIEGCSAACRQRRALRSAAETLGRQFWTHLGRIAAADPKAIGFDANMGDIAPAGCWRHELDKWEKVIDEDELAPQPVARAAIRWLRRNPPPPPPKISVVHGDYRTGNFLFNPEGHIRAILDWEMCHLGDALEDVAWAADPLWAFQRPDRPGGMIGRAEAFAIWEKESGLKVDPERLRWWEVFNSLKGLAIWISAGKEYQTGAQRSDPRFPELVLHRCSQPRAGQASRGTVAGDAPMKPDVDQVMQGFFGTLLMDVAPHLNAEYSMGNVGIMGMMMFMTAEEHDRAAEIRAAENAEMRTLREAAGSSRTRPQEKLAEAAGRATLGINALDRKCGLVADRAANHVEAAMLVGSAEAHLGLYRGGDRRKLPFPSLG